MESSVKKFIFGHHIDTTTETRTIKKQSNNNSFESFLKTKLDSKK